MARSTKTQRPKPKPTPKREEKEQSRLAGFTQNALISGVVSAIVAGLLAYFIAHQQSADADRQAQSAQLTQEAGQLENSATVLYEATTNVYNFNLKCTESSYSWRQCSSVSPDFNSYSSATVAFGPAGLNITDQNASLATNFSSEASKVIGAASVSAAKSDWMKMLNLFSDLEARCAQLIKGQN